MDEEQDAELLGLGPERIELARRQFFAFDAAADRGAAESELLDGFLQLFGRQIGILERNRREPDETIRLRRTPRCQLLVLNLDDLARQFAIRRRTRRH